MKNKPTTLLVGNHLSGAGVNPSVCESLAVRLRECGWRVFTTSHSPGRMARLHDMLGTVWHARHDYDIAHVDIYSGNAFLWAEAVCSLLRVLGKPYVVTLRGGNLAQFARQRRRRVARLLSGAAAITTPSRFLFEHFGSDDPLGRTTPTATPAPVRYGSTDQPINRSTFRSIFRPVACRALGGAPSPIHLIPNPIDAGAYRYRSRTSVQPHLVWVRAFHQIYEPELAVMALGELASEFPTARLTMIGPDKGDGSLERTHRATERRGLSERVVFHGAAAKSELPALLDRGDVFLNTSRVDNTPVSVLEAMAAGLCIVSTNAGGMPYLLRHQHDALLTPCGRPVEMAAAVRRVLLEPALSGQLSRNARCSAEACDWSTVLPLWERLFQTTAHAAWPAAVGEYRRLPRRAS